MSDYNFQLKPAIREAVPPLIALWGISGSGKTYSALLLARGIAGPSGKIAVVDTENGRAKFYDQVAGGWLHLDLQPPFTPEKYTAAFKFCEQEGADVIVVDSASHVWEGEGGVLDAAESATTRKGKPLEGLAKWKNPKMAHKRMVNSLTRSPIPVIFCLRAKESMKQVGSGYDAKIITEGFKPICEKNFIYEMTLAFNMTRDGHFDLQTSKAIPSDLRGSINGNTRLNEEVGRKVAEWMGSGAEVDPETISLRRDGQDAALKGVSAYTGWLATLTPAQKEKVRDYHRGWSTDARQSDASKQENQVQPEAKNDAAYLDDEPASNGHGEWDYDAMGDPPEELNQQTGN